MAGRLKDRVEAEANRIVRERLAHVKDALARALSAAAEPIEFPLSPGDWGAAEGDAQLQPLREALDAIERHPTQREILAALLDAAAAFYPRTAILIVKEGAFAGWAGLGFLGEGGFSSDAVARVRLPAGDHLIARAASARATQRAAAEGPGAPIVAAFGKVRPRESCATPVLLRDRPVAILYGDTGTAGAPAHPLPFEIAARFAALAIERLAAHRGAPLETRGAVAARPPHAPAASRPSPPEEAEMAALLGDLEGAPRAPGGDDDALSDEDRRRHADARRFARLLVSELLLYNEEAVIQGRRNHDLNDRLGKEIDRSRQAYQVRFPATSGITDYFQEELVRMVAQGDPALLGAPSGRGR